MKLLFEKAVENLGHQFPFVLYAKPNETLVEAYFQKNDSVDLFEGQSGFVFAPFSKSALFCISENNSIRLNSNFNKEGLVIDAITLKSDKKHQQHFENSVLKAKEEIAKEHLRKVVLSREINIDATIDFQKTFLNLLEKYDSAFRYLLYHPKFGMWMGATPEQLLKVENTAFKTVSLAGTQLHSEKVVWQDKEKQEQHYVTDFLVSQLQPIVTDLKVGEPMTVQAGALAHIQTKIEGNIKSNTQIETLLNTIHPTPAVCGLPKEPAAQFILTNENYDRSLYTGFLGVYFDASNCNLFVNLRCMQIKKESVSLYVGCGITKDSDEKLEYMETVNKANTMLQIIKLKA